MKRLLLVAVLAMAPMGVGAQNVFPSGGLAATVATGGTAVTALNGPMNGCYIFNPLSTTDQAVNPVEPIYVDPTGIAATTTGNGTNVAIQAGQGWYCPNRSANTISVNAATSGHKFVVVRW